MRRFPTSVAIESQAMPRAAGTAWTQLLLAGGLICCLTSIPHSASAQAPRVQGEWITVPAQITSETYTQLKIDTERAIKNGARIVVFHFQGGELSSFGPSLDLANFLLDRIEARIETVAFVDRPLLGNAVLAALACNKVYLSTGDRDRPEATLGFDQPSLDKLGPVDATKFQAFLNVAERRGRPAALVVKMLAPELVVYQFEADGKRFKLDPVGVERLGLPNRLSLTADERRLQPVVFSPAGKPGLYSASEAEQTGLINRTVPSAQQLVERLGLPPAVLKGNLLGLAQPRAAVIEIRGEIDGGTAEMALRKVKKALEIERANCIIFQVDASGGLRSAERADGMAREIRERCRTAGAFTVAFVPENCTGAAHFLAFACDQIVLGPEATIGDMRAIIYENPASKALADEASVRVIKQQLIQLAEDQLYSPVLIRGMFDLDLEIVAAQERPDPNRPGEASSAVVFLPRAEVGRNWDILPQPPLKKPGQLLILNGDAAMKVGLVRAVLQSKDVEGVLALYGIRRADTIMMKADWLDTLVEVLRSELVTIFLVVLGFTCIVLELKAPGLTIPGVIAVVCFVLVFWAHSWLAGELNALAILLFVLGIVLLGVEVFVLPGFGVTGVAGIVLMLLGLSLLVVKQWPQSQAEYQLLGRWFAVLAGGLVVAMASAFTLARFLPQIPVVNRLMLPAPDEETSDAAATIPPAVPPDLLGQTGTAVTELRPAGKACFGDEFIDVVLDGGWADAGVRVQVIEIDGLRVVVKAI